MSERKIALVTGANKSIGYEVVRGLARLGMTVYLGSRDPAAGEAAAASLEPDGDVRPVRVDVTDRATMEAAVRRIDEAHGRLDVLVNNAGVANGARDPLTSDVEVMKQLYDTNLWGVVILTQLAAPLLRRAGRARVVNVSSGAGAFGFLQADASEVPVKPFAYCTSKTALNAATILFADALKADGVLVNAADPGLVKSALSHFAGTRGPEEGAQAVLELATLPDDGPTGGFFKQGGVPTPW
jgi:NAD(P)-dependent dehydrogenase (short-subunit alcohol dehydrogenase family)